MNWWEWVFSGVGVLALGLLIEWLRRPARPSGPPAAITAQGARVSDSPVASGSGVTQNIGDTHNYYYPPVAAPPPAIEPAQAAEIKPASHRPNLKFAGGKKISLRTEPGDIFRQSLPGLAHGEAVVVSVTNDALPNAPNAGAIVKATLFYRDGEQELLRGMGCWLNEGSGMVEFHVDDLHSVILGVVINGQFSVPTKRRVVHDIGSVSFPTDPNYLNCERATVTIRLTNADTGDLYCETKFEVATNPLGILEPERLGD